ncbi:hypothetical protein A4A49_53553 [Nicotiana attenuata]|uniref:Uncharacterized protein n=1 Tax=Nicotiana attenuata TaxID=49451 RepID=A0A314LD10_NICAT|nr:hypothetical protein A4A49_53553 [Nicotiana attenuata]
MPNMNCKGYSSMAKRKSGPRAITSCAYAMEVYVIWRERNLLRIQKSTYDEDRVSREMAVHIHIRGQNLRKWRKPLSVLSSYLSEIAERFLDFI